MNREDVLRAIKEIQCRYSIPAYEQNYTDKDYACKQYEKLVLKLLNQLEETNNILLNLDCYIVCELVTCPLNEHKIYKKIHKKLQELKKEGKINNEL